MSQNGSLATQEPRTGINEPLCCEDSFPVKKTAMKAKIEDGIIHSPYTELRVPPVSLFSLLAERMRRHGDKTAIVYQDKAVSHGELLQRFRCITAGLQSMGVGKGDRVYARFRSPSPDGLAALCGVMFSGATLIIVGEFTEAEHLASIRSLNVTHLLTDADTADKLIPLLPQLKLKGKLSVDDVPGFACVSPLQWGDDETFRDEVGHEDEVTLIAYSSGTSGIPKNIEIPRRSIPYCLAAADVSHPFTSDDVCLTGASICTYIGLTYSLKGLYCGATFVMIEEKRRLTGILDTIKKHKVTWYMSPPLRALSLAWQVRESGCGAPPSLKSIVLAGAPLTASVAREVVTTLKPEELRNIYGTTETGGNVTVPPRGECAYDNVGFPLCGHRIKIIDMDSGAVLGPMKEGEVLVHSPGVMNGYYNMPAETEAALDSQGWFHTGDVGYYDEDGRLYLVDRVKFTMECLGRKVSPCELEDVLLSHPALAEAAVLGVSREDVEEVAGEVPAAIVVPRRDCETGLEQLAEELKSLIAARLSNWKRLLGGVYIADAIPKTETGKIRRSELPMLILSLRRIDRTS